MEAGKAEGRRLKVIIKISTATISLNCLSLIYRKKLLRLIMTHVAILADGLANLGRMLVIMAAETTVTIITILVPKVLTIGAPGYCHLGPDIIEIGLQ